MSEPHFTAVEIARLLGYHEWRLRDVAAETSPLYADDGIDPSDPDFAILSPASQLH